MERMEGGIFLKKFLNNSWEIAEVGARQGKNCFTSAEFDGYLSSE